MTWGRHSSRRQMLRSVAIAGAVAAGRVCAQCVTAAPMIEVIQSSMGVSTVIHATAGGATSLDVCGAAGRELTAAAPAQPTA